MNTEMGVNVRKRKGNNNKCYFLFQSPNISTLIVLQCNFLKIRKTMTSLFVVYSSSHYKTHNSIIFNCRSKIINGYICITRVID